jgi:hypothetical protein
VDKRIVWFKDDAFENEFEFDVTFLEAKEVIQNEASLKVPNISRDFTFIGLTDDMEKVLSVYSPRCRQKII